MIRLIKDKSRPLVLDLGAGNGEAGAAFARKGFNVIAIDLYDTSYGYNNNAEAFEDNQLLVQQENIPHLAIVRASSSDIF